MSIIQGNAHTSAGGGGFNVERSLRFNSADSAYLNRTIGATATNAKIGTLSMWVKRSALTNTTGNSQYLIQTGISATTDSGHFTMFFTTSDTLALGQYSWAGYLTPQVFRDSSAWYHIVLSYNSTLASNNLTIYVNGVSIGVTSVVQNTDWAILSGTEAINIGRHTSVGRPFNGYMTEIHLIDGQALTPSSFGETDTNTGVWKPKAYSGTYGTNGFYLKFADNSGTTSTTLGKDSSGNSNNWTPNNFSVTAGVGNDSLVDTPTNYGTDTGAGGEVRGNYATSNPNDYQGSTGLSNGNLDISGTSVGNFGTIKVTSGKWYFEFRKNANGDNQLGIASGNIFQSASNYGVTCFRRVWRDNAGSPVWLTDGSNAGSGTAQSLTTGDILGVALDLDNNAVYFAKNNTWMNSGVPTSGASKTGAIWTDLSGGTWQITASANANGCYTSLNSGQRAFAYTAPSGFKALCITNLPTPTIGATSATQANDYFNAVTYSGTSATQTVTGVNFQPDFVWIKNRSNGLGFNHVLQDAVRGFTTGKKLASNLTTAEGGTNITDDFGYVSSANSDGFVLSKSGTGSYEWYQTNATGNSYVAWNWNAGGSTVTNTAGTISAQVRANTTSGFSIATLTAQSSGTGTFGHGLGVAPSMMILKQIGSSGNWIVWHSTFANTEYIVLNTTAAKTTGATTYWNSTTPTSTLITLGSAWGTAGTMVCYAFAPVAGYSAFGSYAGNGSTDGPFIYTGFRPRFILRKGTVVAGVNWSIIDTARNTYNLADANLFPNLSNAESVPSGEIDILSNGFKARSTSFNASGEVYIYMAFAESPFKYALAR